MEVWVLISIAIIYATWIVLGIVVLVGLLLAILTRRLRAVGIALVALAGGYMVFLFFTPEWIAAKRQPLEATTFAPAGSFEVPKTLVVHGLMAHAIDNTSDVLALAETGLFRVLFVTDGGVLEDQGYVLKHAATYEAIVKERSDCIDARPQQKSVDVKLSTWLFTARTGFTRCASLAPSFAELPRPRLELKGLYPKHDKHDPGLRGIMTVELVGADGSRRTVAQRIRRARQVAGSYSRLGSFTYTERPEHSESSGFSLSYNPDIVGFVLEAVRSDPDALPTSGRMSDADLAARATTIVATAGQRRRLVAVALAGATASPDGAKAVERALAHVLVSRTTLDVSVHSDCLIADRLASARGSLAPVCAAAKMEDDLQCVVPLYKPTFLEQCGDGVRDIVWQTPSRGRRTVVLGENHTGIATTWIVDKYPASTNRVFIHPEGGLQDLVLVSKSQTLWSLGGSLGCIGRLTVIGRNQGLVGLPARDVRFRYRNNADYYEHGKPGARLLDLLGAPPQTLLSTERDGSVTIGSDGPKAAPCRDTISSPPPPALPALDTIVTEATDIAFRRP